MGFVRLRRFLLVPVVVASLGTAPAGVAHATFDYSSFGFKAGMIIPEERRDAFAFGVHLELDKPRTNFLMLPSIIYWSSRDVTDLNANFDAYYHFSRWAAMAPFLGAGIGTHLLRLDHETHLHLGASLFGGVQIPAPGMDWFVEGRYTSTEVSQIGVFVGITRRH